MRGLMQSFARADAKLCEDGCKALRESWAKLALKSSVLFWIKEKRKKDSPYGVLRPKEISTEPRRAQPRVERSGTLGVSGI